MKEDIKKVAASVQSTLDAMIFALTRNISTELIGVVMLLKPVPGSVTGDAMQFSGIDLSLG